MMNLSQAVPVLAAMVAIPPMPAVVPPPALLAPLALPGMLSTHLFIYILLLINTNHPL